MISQFEEGKMFHYFSQLFALCLKSEAIEHTKFLLIYIFIPSNNTKKSLTSQDNVKTFDTVVCTLIYFN